MGILSSQASNGFQTPSEVYEHIRNYEASVADEQAMRRRAELQEHLQDQERARQENATMARNDLESANLQTLPTGVEVHRTATDETDDDLPPLEPIEKQIAEEEEDEQDEQSTQAPDIARKHKETID